MSTCTNCEKSCRANVLSPRESVLPGARSLSEGSGYRPHKNPPSRSLAGTPIGQGHTKKFLSLASYYRRFVRNFASITKPLHRLTEKTAIFEWTVECQEAFAELRHRLCTAPVLAFPDFTSPLFWTPTPVTQALVVYCHRSMTRIRNTSLLSPAAR
jgi:hypothetical protein